MGSEARTVQLEIEGMVCGSCVNTVATALTGVPGVRSAEVAATVLVDSVVLVGGRGACGIVKMLLRAWAALVLRVHDRALGRFRWAARRSLWRTLR